MQKCQKFTAKLRVSRQQSGETWGNCDPQGDLSDLIVFEGKFMEILHQTWWLPASIF